MNIHIKNLKILGILGILEHERDNKQEIVINIKIRYKYKKNIIDYADIINIVTLDIIESKYMLIEELIQSIANKLKISFKNISMLKIKVEKPDIISNTVVGVSKKFKYKMSL